MDCVVIDGVRYPNMHVASLKRNFAVMDGENAGRVLTGRMERDVIGTFYNYSCVFDPDGASLEEYDSFYEAISAPVDSHIVVLPYGQTTLTFEAYVVNGEDEAVMILDDKAVWGKLSVNFVSMEPQRAAV